MRLVDKLRNVTCVLLDPELPTYSLRGEVLELKSIFESAGGLKADTTRDIASGETVTAGGVAISPKMASMCVDDFARTVQFIRGTHAAIADLRRKILDRPVRVLYAGCGPWAPLAVPRMTIFRADDVQFELLDIHERSIRSVERITEHMELTDCVEDLTIADACSYQVDITRPPDLIVIEMLRAALESEPQVAVTINLFRQVPDCVTIPEEVRIDLALVDVSREFSFDDEEPVRDRVMLGTVLRLDRETVSSGAFLSKVVRLPEFDEQRYRPMLLTMVRVHGEHCLRDYDSGVTCPKSVTADRELRSGDALEFVYEGGSYPRMAARTVAG